MLNRKQLIGKPIGLAIKLGRPFTCSLLMMVALTFTLTLHAASTSGRQAITTGVLRVCADPANMPFSNDELEGFENKIIAKLAERLELDVRYTWFPQSVGFVRNTLRLRECDLISGITTTSQMVQNTNPYYHSIYTMVYRADSGITATTMSDDQLKLKKLGVVAGTPPATVLARFGLLRNITPYQLVADTRVNIPALEAIQDVDQGKTDVAFIWGPIAAYYASQAKNHLTVVPLLVDAAQNQLSFRVSMAVRFNEPDWKRKINRVLKDLSPDIVSILTEYEVPLLNDRGNLMLE